MRGSGLKTTMRKMLRNVLVGGIYTSLTMLTLDYGVAGHLFDEAPFLARVEVEVEGIYGREEKK
jgi:hypothetical protein